MSQAPSCRPPAILDVFCRDDENLGRQEAAVIFREVRTGGGWVGILVTGERFFELTAERYTMAVHHDDWRPVSWAWDDRAMLFAPPDQEWDVAAKGWVEKDVAQAPAALPLPTKSALAKPRKSETLPTWMSRNRRKFPSLETEAGSLLLGEAWNDHKMSMSPG